MIESAAVAVTRTAPPDVPGSGLPEGPAVIVKVSGTEFTRWTNDALAFWPWASLITTETVQVCWTPVALTGVVHTCVPGAPAANTPLPRPPEQVAVQV